MPRFVPEDQDALAATLSGDGWIGANGDDAAQAGPALLQTDAGPQADDSAVLPVASSLDASGADALTQDGAGDDVPPLRASDTPHSSSTVVSTLSSAPQSSASWSAATITLAPVASDLSPPVMVSGAVADLAMLDAAPGAAAQSGAPLLDPGAGPDSGITLAPLIVNAVDPVSDQADQVVLGNAARNTYGVDGTGIKIGIISDSFNLAGGAAADEADGALPSAANVHILQDGTSGEDEGRAMAQIAHSIAPGAQIYFYTDGDTDASMAQAITALQAAGCQIILDDVSFFDEPFYEEGGTISAAVNQVVAEGSTYFTAANNFANSYYEGNFTPVAVAAQGGGTVEAQEFNVAGAPANWLEPITIPRNATAFLDLQWDQPFDTADGSGNGPGSANSLAYNLFRKNSNGTLTLVAAGTQNDIGNDPLQLGEYTNNTSGTTFYLAVFQNVAQGPLPGQFKIIVADNAFSPVVFNDPNAGIGSGTVIGHEADPAAITVGAAPESNPTTMEPFSAYGPGEYLFDANGNRLTTPVSGDKINIVAPDGNSTSTVINPFYGTSAATPAAGAVGALMLEANAALDPTDVANILEDSATPIAGNADLTGAGMVDALLAVGEAETLVFTETATTATLLGTHLADTFVGGAGSHAIDGQGGADTLDYSAAPGAVTVNFQTGTATNGYGGTDLFSNIETAKGSAFNDAFTVATLGETLYGGGGLDSVNFAALGALGALALDGGSFTGTGGNAGAITVANGAALTIAGALANSGTLRADNGTLDVSGAITGAGSAYLADGGVFEIGGADTQSILFGGTPATLKLDLPASFAGTIAGLALGDIIDLVGTAVTSAPINGSILTVNESGGGHLTYTLAGALTGDFFKVTSDGSTGSDLVLSTGLPLAQATINTPSPVNLGKARIGGTLSQALSITNSAASPAEALDASIALTSGAATASGTISLLGAGQSDASHIVVGLATAAAGAVSGAATLAFKSDGAGTDGQAPTALANQTVLLSGSVYRLAAPTVGALPQNLIVHVGDTVARALTITNTAAGDGYSEALIASAGAITGGIVSSGSTGDIAAQGSSSALTVGFSTASAGTVAGSVTLNFQSDGSGVDGFGPTAIGSQVVAVNATVDNYAAPVLEELSGGGTWSQNGTSYTLNLGTVVHGANPIAIALGALNAASGPTDLLAGSFATTASSAFALAGFGAFSGLGAGQADTQPAVTFSAGTAGTFTETITFTPTGSNTSGYSAALAPETLTITGTVSQGDDWGGPKSSNRTGDWNTASNWTVKMVPASLTTAVISAAGTYTVSSAQSNTVAGLTVSDAGATLAITGGTFGVRGTIGTTNAGTIAVQNGASLQLTVTTTNTGTIALQSTGAATTLSAVGSITLKGTGTVALGDSAGNRIASNGADATLTNSTTIAGSGKIGDGLLMVINAAGGVIDATGAVNALTIATGANALTNSGVIEATGAAGLVIANSTITQGVNGVIAAAGGNVYLQSATLTGDVLQSSGGGAVTTRDSGSVLNTVTNTGKVVVTDGTSLTLKGNTTNSGTIALNSTGDATLLVLGAAVTLQGGGAVILSDAAANAIQSNGTSLKLTNSATIAGAGTIGDANLTLVNSANGVIDATGASNVLTISDTGHTATNAGLLEATGAGGLAVTGNLSNTGTLAASGGTLTINGGLTNNGTLVAGAGGTLFVHNSVGGTGQATIAGGTLDLGGTVAATQAITFAQGQAGILKLGGAQNFAGTVAGLAAGDAIDLANFSFSGRPTVAAVAAIVQNGSTVGAAVTVKDGSLSTTIDLLNQFGVQYSTNPTDYALASDNAAHPGTLLELAHPSV